MKLQFKRTTEDLWISNLSEGAYKTRTSHHQTTKMSPFDGRSFVACVVQNLSCHPKFNRKSDKFQNMSISSNMLSIDGFKPAICFTVPSLN